MTRKVLVLVGILATLISVFAAGNTLTEIFGPMRTFRDFLQVVDPSAISAFPAAVLDAEIRWHAGPTCRWQGDRLHDGQEMRTVLLINHSIALSERNRMVTFGASTTVIYPPFLRMPSMFVAAYLFDGEGRGLKQTSDSGSNVWRVTTSASYYMAGGGTCFAASYHVGQAPAGCEPPGWVDILTTGLLEVD